MEYLESKETSNRRSPINLLLNVIKRINKLHNIDKSNTLDFDNDEDETYWEFCQRELIVFEGKLNLPVPVFSIIKPTLGARFILHILLSLGEFETEQDLLLHPTLRETLQYAKLIGDETDEESLNRYVDELMVKIIVESFQYLPSGKKIIDNWIITFDELLKSVIIDNSLPIVEMPPVLQARLNKSVNDECNAQVKKFRDSLTDSSLQEIGDNANFYSIPSKDELKNATFDNPLEWNAIEIFCQGAGQSDE